jgi:FKBP-type peptidyl-prolyl cis-trans isomerase
LDTSNLPAGAPTVEMPTEIKPVLVKTDLKVGEGTEVTATDTVIVNYIGVSCSTGKVFDSSWSRRQPAQFNLAQLIPGWSQGLVGMRPGGQRQMVIPPALAYGQMPPQGSGIAPDETLVFVVDLVSAGPSVATPSTTAPAPVASAKGKPCVAPNAVPAADGKPEVPVPVGPPPTELETEDLKVGDGPAVAAGDTVTVNYVGISCSTGKQFDSSWDRGRPANFSLDQVIPGWTKGIPGMQVGGQRLLVIPPDQAYGAEGRPGIAPDETLVFVVELVKIGE